VIVGGVRKSFVLDARGRATLGDDSLKLKEIKKQPGVAKLSLKCRHGDFATLMQPFGLTNADLPKSAAAMAAVPVGVVVAGRQVVRTLVLPYSAKLDQKGKAKGKLK
jgi:hypothetical protein